jgi:hypothetical protein
VAAPSAPALRTLCSTKTAGTVTATAPQPISDALTLTSAFHSGGSATLRMIAMTTLTSLRIVPSSLAYLDSSSAMEMDVDIPLRFVMGMQIVRIKETRATAIG